MAVRRSSPGPTVVVVVGAGVGVGVGVGDGDGDGDGVGVGVGDGVGDGVGVGVGVGAGEGAATGAGAGSLPPPQDVSIKTPMKKSDGASLADCVHETIELWGTTAREVRNASLLTHSTPDAMNSHARQLVCRGEPNCPLTLDAGMEQITLGCAWWFRKYAEEQSHEDRQATPMRRTRPEKRGSVCGVTVIGCRRGTGALARHASQERNVDRARSHASSTYPLKGPAICACVLCGKEGPREREPNRPRWSALKH